MENLDEFGKEVLKECIRVTKASNALPQHGDEYDYYCSFAGFQTFTSKIGVRISNLIDKLFQFENLHVQWLAVEADAEQQFDALIESNDTLLERVSSLLDEATSKVTVDRRPKNEMTDFVGTEIASWNKKTMGHTSFRMSQGDVPRPQACFRDMVDNSSTPFVPLLFHKPNQLKPLPEVFTKLQSPTTLQALIENTKEWSKSIDKCTHPYIYEIEQFKPTPAQLTITDPTIPGALDDTPLIMVDNLDVLQSMISTISSVSEIAVDLEHHSYRSFQGFLCLMQISTRTCDYIVDCIALRQHLQQLNTVFTNPSIVKVLHGADWDVQWLQRDFGIYIVNLFDTGQASRVLQLPKYSLAFLLDYCCDVKANKQYQLADWRVRPLPNELIKYAREDTHYLLFIYDRMRNELIRRNGDLITTVIDRSRDIAKKTYKRSIFHEQDHLKLCYKFRRPLNIQQSECLRLVYKWRDDLARQEDESPGYILPNHMLFQICETLPKTQQGILACCNPVPSLVRQYLLDLARLVGQARGYVATPLDNNQASIYTEDRHDNPMDTDGSLEGASDDSKCHVSILAIEPNTAVDIKECAKAVPENIQKHFQKIELKFKNILGMYQPVDRDTAATTTLCPSQTDVYSSEEKVLAKPTKRPRSLLDQHSPPVKHAKKAAVVAEDNFTPYHYAPSGFSKTVHGQKSSKEEFNPNSSNTGRNSYKRAPVKVKSSRTTSTTNKTWKTKSPQWPT